MTREVGTAHPRAVAINEALPSVQIRRHEYGLAVEWADGDDRLGEADVLAMLQADAARHLPPGTGYEVRVRPAGVSTRSGELLRKGMAWYRDERPEAERESDLGAVTTVHGQYRTPVRHEDSQP